MTGAALVLLVQAATSAPAAPFPDAVEAVIRETWAVVETRTPSTWRDKNVPALRVGELLEEARPSLQEVASAIARVEALRAELPEDDHWTWRLEHVLGRLEVARGDRTAARARVAEALRRYPHERYEAPVKHSSFHHLVNEAAGLAWDDAGFDAARELLRGYLGDPRMQHVYVPWWEKRLRAAGLEARLPELLGMVESATSAGASGRGCPAAHDIVLDFDAHARYRLIHATGDDPPAASGRGLVVVLPGGDGGAGFAPFVERLHRDLLGSDWIVAQPIAPRWSEEQVVTWPTRRLPAEGMAFPAETLVARVIEDVHARFRIDPQRTYLLGWSSGGPPVLASLLEPGVPVAGGIVAMSVFKPDLLPPLEGGRGRTVVLLHSPEDGTCPFAMAEQARTRLAEAGALTRLVTYPGGHGWNDAALASLREALGWLAAPTKPTGQPPNPGG